MFEEATGAGRKVLGLGPISLLDTGDLPAGVGGRETVAGSGGIVSSSLLALAEARVH